MEKIIHFIVPAIPSLLYMDHVQKAKTLHPDWDIRIWDSPPSGSPMY
jgi:hypothetical protein